MNYNMSVSSTNGIAHVVYFWQDVIHNMAIRKPKDFLLYSTGTELAFKIAKDYYHNIHFVWCTDAFDAFLQPGTSNPRTMCSRYLDQIIKNDRHAVEIKNNKAGIIKGANAKLANGIITSDQYKEICTRVALAENREFYPVIFLIDKRAVKKRLHVVAQQDAASNSSVEYIIDDLQSNEFELVRVKDLLAGVISPLND